MEVLDKYGPVAVAMDSSDPNFVSYSVGTFGTSNGQYGSPGTCTSDKLGSNFKEYILKIIFLIIFFFKLM